MPRWIWSLLVLFAFLALLKRALILMILARLRLRPVAYRALSGDEVAAWERELLQGAAGVLGAQGFRFAGYASLPDPVAGRSTGRTLAFFEHGSEPIWASVIPADIPAPQNPFQIVYISCFTNGRILHTRPLSERIFPPVPGYAIDDQVAIADYDGQFGAHRKSAAEMGRSAAAERIGFPALLFLGGKILADELDAMRERGYLVPDGGDEYRLSLRGLWLASRTMARTAAPAAKLRQAWAARGENFPLPPEAEAEAFLRIVAVGPRLGNWGKALLILASLAAFSMLSGGGFSWLSGAMLLAIVFIHEMGHALAMRWVGYRDVNVFFVPFFGAVAVGRQERHPEAWKEAFILLAGPVPGLAAGFAALTAGGELLPVWAYQAAFTSVFVNGFNLLPIAPLDGGQLMQLILFRRFPRLNKVFLVLSAVAVAGVAWWAKSPMLGFFAFVLLWGLYKGGKIGGKGRDEAGLAGIRARYGSGRDAAGAWDAGMIAEFFASLRAGKPQPFPEKLNRIKAFLAGPADGQTARPAGLPAALGVFAVYACIMMAPLAWYALPLIGPMLHQAKLIKRADLEPGQARVYDGLCRDSAVYRISMYTVRDSLHLHVSVIAPADTGRVEALGGELAGREAVRLSVHTPIWGLGELDSAVLFAANATEQPEYGDYESEDSATAARFEAMDSVSRAAWRDSVEAVRRAYEDRMDSLQRVEAGIWESWPAERRKEWLARWKQKRQAGQGLDCFKG
jgi:Zn-dependent protease